MSNSRSFLRLRFVWLAVVAWPAVTTAWVGATTRAPQAFRSHSELVRTTRRMEERLCHRPIRYPWDTRHQYAAAAPDESPEAAVSPVDPPPPPRVTTEQPSPKTVTTHDWSSISFDTALCVVPPDDAWDLLQRARHEAQDASYATWPPAIRLFHPMCDVTETHEMALHMADLITEYDVAPFAVTLSEWSIIPHVEAMEAQRRGFPAVEHGRGQRTWTPDELQTQQLIAKEERIGKEKLREKQEKQRQKHVALGRDVPPAVTAPPAAAAAPVEESFNGPCVICLEPNRESVERLQAVRYLFQHGLPGAADSFADWYTPTSSVTTAITNANANAPPPSTRLRRRASRRSMDQFRPVVPIAAFATVSSAIAVARKLRKLWRPLTFNVTDLHVLSRASYKSDGNSPRAATMAQGSDEYVSSPPFGCDALISLVGEEVEMDAELNQEMAQALFLQGEAGGYQSELAVPVDESSSGSKTAAAAARNLEHWLEEDDDYDEGTVVVIGRTQLFTGEMRHYVGMPASSHLDANSHVGRTKSS